MKTFGAKVVSAVNVSNKGWQNVGWATILTAIGAGVTYLAGHIGEIDMQKLGQYGPLVMTVVVPLLSYIKNKTQEALKNTDVPVPTPPAPNPPSPTPAFPNHPNFHNELDFHLINRPK